MAVLIIGFAGMLIVLFAFFMIEFEKWKSSHLVYDLSNFIGGMLLVVYAVLIKSHPFLILNIAWSLIALRDVILNLKKSNKKKHSISHKKK